MALHDDLLDQADHLASREPKRPRQASLRRAVSAAYYALFHMLAADGAGLLVPPRPALLRAQVRRAYVHANMRDVCRRFSRLQPSDALAPLLTLPLEADLVSVAEAFVALQQAGHEADYDFTTSFNRIDVLQRVQHPQAAVAHWRAVRSSPNATGFFVALLLRPFG